MHLVTFCDILSGMEPQFRPFYLVSFTVTHHFVACHYSHINVCDSNKNYRAWENIEGGKIGELGEL